MFAIVNVVVVISIEATIVGGVSRASVQVLCFGDWPIQFMLTLNFVEDLGDGSVKRHMSFKSRCRIGVGLPTSAKVTKVLMLFWLLRALAMLGHLLPWRVRWTLFKFSLS